MIQAWYLSCDLRQTVGKCFQLKIKNKNEKPELIQNLAEANFAINKLF